MVFVQTWLTACLAVAALVGLERLCRRRPVPRMPLRLPVLAVLAWALLRSLPLDRLALNYHLWIGVVDDLLLALAALRLLIWTGLEVPAAYGWWRRPPELLLQLIMLLGSALITVVVVRESARLDLVGLVATSAVATAMIGLAAQEPLKDLFAGLELQLGDDFQLGDWLELPSGPRGVVVSINWRDTCLRNIDNCLVVIPNHRITADVLYNRAAFGVAGDRFSIGLDYDYPPARARALLEGVLRQHPKVLADPAPYVRVLSFDESSIGYEIQVWQREVGDRAMYDLRGELLEQIWYALLRDGQSIPYPVRELKPRRSVPPEKAPDRPSPETCRQALASHSLFADLTPEQLETLVRGSRLVSYGPGEAIVVEGAEGQSMYHLLRGRVEVLKQVAPDRTVPVRQLGAGDIFGEMTLFLDAPRSATVRGIQECLLLRVSRDSVRTLLEQNPSLLERFAALVSARRAELDSLSQQQRQEQTNALLDTMKRLFFALKGI